VSPGAATPQSTIGSFWALGFGNPALYAGNDNGSLRDEDGWVSRFLGYTYIDGNWAWNGIDGCIHGKVAPGKSAEIMVAEFLDRSNDGIRAYFAAAEVALHLAEQEQFDFATGIGRDITLAEIPKPFIASSGLIGPHEIEIVVPGPTSSQIALGFFSDGTAELGEVIAGYRVYGHTHPGGSEPLPDRRRDAGWIPLSGTVPFGVAATVIVDCTQLYAFLAQSIVYDSGFESAYVSERSTTIKCEMCTGDADRDGWMTSVSCGAVDCDDAYALTYPGARESNDGIDNQCPGDPGYGILDELDGTIGFANPDDKQILSWPAQAGASTYEAARSSDPAFSAGCTPFESATTSITDPGIPPPQAVFYYVVRPMAPYAGSWGMNSAGGERSTSCP